MFFFFFAYLCVNGFSTSRHSKGNSQLLWAFSFLFIWIHTSSVTMWRDFLFGFPFLAFKWMELWENGLKPIVVFFLFFFRGHWFTRSLFVPVKHFGKMKGIIKVRRTSASGHPGELWEEQPFPSVGLLLCWLAGICPPACDRAKDEPWQQWWETSLFLITQKEIRS